MSRATIIDERPDEEDTTLPEESAVEAVETPVEEQSQDDSDVPEKYRNKSFKEVVQMHQEVEKIFNQHSAEVGNSRKELNELRQLVDNYIQTELSAKEAPEQQQVDDSEDVDFFVDPQKAVDSRIANHPKIKEAEVYTQQAKQQATLAQLKSKHPEMEAILQDPKFAEWIKGSKVRTKLFVDADQFYDYDAADELFTLFKERNQVVQQTANAELAARKNTVKSAATGNARGSAEGSRKKVYRRADIIRLIKTDPERYQSLSDDILKAYAEGRVK
tara:strand:+ start:1425 stop:2246 length:822 start_codon:yes stop_codon:yes gene_type:complete